MLIQNLNTYVDYMKGGVKAGNFVELKIDTKENKLLWHEFPDKNQDEAADDPDIEYLGIRVLETTPAEVERDVADHIAEKLATEIYPCTHGNDVAWHRRKKDMYRKILTSFQCYDDESLKVLLEKLKKIYRVTKTDSKGIERRPA